MTQSDESLSPLESGWRNMREQMLARKPRSVGELVRAQIMFYAGARHVIVTAAAEQLTLPIMAVEIREFQRSMKEALADQDEKPCQPMSIS